MWVCVRVCARTRGDRSEKTRKPLQLPEKTVGMDILVPATKNLCGSDTQNTESAASASSNSRGSPLVELLVVRPLYPNSLSNG